MKQTWADRTLIWYAAGLFDGEGCVTFYSSKGYVNPVLVIGMTNREVLEAFAARWGGRVHAFPSMERSRQMYHWRLFGGNAKGFATAIYPHLRVKRAELALVLPLLGHRGRQAEKHAARIALATLRMAS